MTPREEQEETTARRTDRPSRPMAAAAVLGVLSLAMVPWAGLRGQPGPGAAAHAGPGAPPDAWTDRAPADTGGAEWFPSRTSFAPLLAAPREVALRGAFLAADRPERPDDFTGTNVEADVALGHRLPVVRLQRADAGRPELTLGFEAGVFTRFFMESPQKDLINADFRVGAPFSARWGAWQGRLTLLHVSSHLGDDFVSRFGPSGRQVTRDGLELLVARRLGAGARVYAGGEWNFHVNPGVERTAARAGLEWDPDPRAAGRRPGRAASGSGVPAVASRRRGGDRVGGAGEHTGNGAPDGGGGVEAWPFVAADARVTSLTDDVAGSAAGGLALRVEGVVLRLEARGHFGPAPLGKLRTRDETSAGLGLRVEP